MRQHHIYLDPHCGLLGRSIGERGNTGSPIVPTHEMYNSGNEDGNTGWVLLTILEARKKKKDRFMSLKLLI